jgi:hypothetical protein
MDMLEHLPQAEAGNIDPERLAYSIKESAALLGVDYFLASFSAANCAHVAHRAESSSSRALNC